MNRGIIGGLWGRVGHSSWTPILKKYFLEEIISELDAVLHVIVYLWDDD